MTAIGGLILDVAGVDWSVLMGTALGWVLEWLTVCADSDAAPPDSGVSAFANFI